MADVSQDPRYIKVVPDVRSELAIPMLLKDRCIGVVDLESPELDAFTKRDVEILTLLASQAAVAIENARLYEEVRANEVRLEKELRFAQRVQSGAAADRAAEADEGGRGRRPRSLRRASSAATSTTTSSPESNMLVVALGDVSGKGVPAALYSVFAAEAGARPHVPAPLSARALGSGGRARRRSTRSCTSGSSRSTTARSATRSSI